MAVFDIEHPETYRAALYLRVSKEDEGEGESGSITNQRKLLAAFAAAQQLCITDTYADDGISGTSARRPGLQRMLGDIALGRINMVLTKDLSRLSRDYTFAGEYLERYFPEHHVRYISLLDGIDTGVDSASNDIMPFRAVMNDMYAKDISKKILAVKHDKQLRGDFIGWKAPYGYKTSAEDKNHLLTDEPAAQVVRRLFQLAAGGTSCHAAAVLLNGEGVPSPSAYAGLQGWRKGPYSGLWNAQRIAEMLRNPVYVGDMVQGRRKKAGYKSKKCIALPPEQWKVIPNTHEPLVTRAQFALVQQLLQGRGRTRTRKADFPLKGLLRCKECGYPLTTRIRTLSGGRTAVYLQCRTYARFSRAGVCSSHSVPAQLITEAVYAEVRTLCAHCADPAALAAAAKREYVRTETQQGRAQKLQRLAGEEAALKRQIDRTYQSYLDEVLLAEDFKRIYADMNARHEALQAKIQALRAQPEGGTEAERQRQLAASLQAFLAADPPSQALLCALIDHIDYGRDKELFIHYRCAEPRDAGSAGTQSGAAAPQAYSSLPKKVLSAKASNVFYSLTAGEYR